MQPLGNPYIALLDRTIENLDTIQTHMPAYVLSTQFHDVTQTINSFQSVLVMPHEKIFNIKALNGSSNQPASLSKHGLNMLKSSSPLSDVGGKSLGTILTSIRHAFAHGHVTLLTPSELIKKSAYNQAVTVGPNEIAGIEIIALSDSGNGPREWGCVLTVDEMRDCLLGLQKLTREENFVVGSVWKEQKQAFPNYGASVP